MKYLLVTLAALLGCACTAHTMTPQQFADTFAAAMQTERPAIAVKHVRELELLVSEPNGRTSTAFLDNAYKAYTSNPDNAKETIARYVASFLSGMTVDVALDRNRIVPIVKDRQWLHEVNQSLRQSQSARAIENVYEDLNAELVVVYAEDSPQTLRYFEPKALEDIRLRREDLRTLAIGNLENLLPPIEIHAGDEVSMVTAGGDFEASILLLDKFWSSGKFKYEGELVVAIPARDILVVTGTKTAKGVLRARELAAKYRAQSPYPLTDTLFVYRGARFVRYNG